MKIDLKVKDTRTFKIHMGRGKVRCEEAGEWSCSLSLIPIFRFWKIRNYGGNKQEDPCIYIWGINVVFLYWNIALVSGSYKRMYNGPWEENDIRG